MGMRIGWVGRRLARFVVWCRVEVGVVLGLRWLECGEVERVCDISMSEFPHPASLTSKEEARGSSSSFSLASSTLSELARDAKMSIPLSEI